MRIVYFFFAIMFLFSADVFGQQNLLPYSDVEKKLDDLILRQHYFVKKREDMIAGLKQQAALVKREPGKYFDANYRIYEGYRKFQSDSAIAYVLKCQTLAHELKDDALRIRVDLDLAALYSTVGRYIESKKLLENIDRNKLDPKFLPSYYETYSSFYSHYGQSNNMSTYYQQSELYRDSLLSVLDRSSEQYAIVQATQTLFKGDRNAAEGMLLKLLDTYQNDLENKAMTAYFLGLIYQQNNDIPKKKYYYAVSACADIEHATRDNASLQDLALSYYEQGDFDRAFKLIEKAIDDAMVSNVRYRVIEGTSFYPLINAAYQQRIEQQKKVLLIYLILISVLSVVLIAGIVYLYRQMSHLAKTRKALSETNERLKDLNEDLSLVNMNLSESNHIKEEYIARFFDMCSSYIDKMEDLRKSVLKQASNNQIKPLIEQLKSTRIVEHEVEELYKNFDRIFLNLYPAFIQDFNSLLLAEEQIWPKKGELLNTELRIFALIRLGITDSVKIAGFLRYSLRTVYNYRTKVRNKAAVERADFEDIVRQIGLKVRNNH
ncbi:DUF6377 domain-containing protein [Sphingobacterium spiritivorum]|uniref:DUF6377 domain-containing protein n=1 Tax=Sphingobacterium spiritivorum TaxID=258 RepID=UPI003DA5830F